MRLNFILSAGLATLIASGTATLAQATVDLPNDELLCYQAKQTKILPKFVGTEIRTDDQFETQVDGRNYLAAKYVSVCNPQNPIVNSEVHYVGYSLKESKVNLNAAKFAPPLTVYNLSDRITDLIAPVPGGVTISKPKELFVRSGKTRYGNALVKCGANPDCALNGTATECNVTGGICVNPGAPPPAAPTDLTNTADYMCYAIKGPKLVFPTQANLSDQFGFVQSYLPNKITKVCAPADLNVPPAPASNPTFPGHLICYQAKSTKTNPAKFSSQVVATSNVVSGNDYLEAKKVTDMCIPALKAVGVPPANGTPTTLTTIARASMGDCGDITTDLGGAEGVPGRRSTSSPSTNPNAVCTGAGVPKACCEAGTGVGHCDEGTNVVCGSSTFGGGGSGVMVPGTETVQAGGDRARYGLSCVSGTDPACVISGNAGDIPNGVRCTTLGCGTATPIELAAPAKVCVYATLGAPASGTLNLVTGAVSVSQTNAVAARVFTSTSFATTACPRCRTAVAVSSAPVFASGGASGVGVCDADSTNSGALCHSFEGAGPTAGLSTDCIPIVGGGTGTINLATTATTAGDSLASPTGNFCAAQGQGGISQCTAAGVPQSCCTGLGTGTCKNFNGCFGSSNGVAPRYADIPAVCTGISVTGSSTQLWTGFSNPGQKYGDVACVPAVNSGNLLIDGLSNENGGLPGPLATSSFSDFLLE